MKATNSKFNNYKENILVSKLRNIEGLPRGAIKKADKDSEQTHDSLTAHLQE